MLYVFFGVLLVIFLLQLVVDHTVRGSGFEGFTSEMRFARLPNQLDQSKRTPHTSETFGQSLNLFARSCSLVKSSTPDPAKATNSEGKLSPKGRSVPDNRKYHAKPSSAALLRLHLNLTLVPSVLPPKPMGVQF